VHPLNIDRECNIERFAFRFLFWLTIMQTAAQNRLNATAFDKGALLSPNRELTIDSLWKSLSRRHPEVKDPP
jgi:hypothetical protein